MNRGLGIRSCYQNKAEARDQKTEENHNRAAEDLAKATIVVLVDLIKISYGFIGTAGFVM